MRPNIWSFDEKMNFRWLFSFQGLPLAGQDSAPNAPIDRQEWGPVHECVNCRIRTGG